MSKRRTTIELDEDLLARAQAALGQPTMRSTVEEALRRALDDVETATAGRRGRQRAFLERLSDYIDSDVLASDQMWR
ncbi:MAG: type II toxin-antitoxin system VapB family antitoxin [Actinomycetota bacterium]|nr:type II toxin-antitoxin system VapB family antitoxin [Actinomycetota bacterium]